MKINRILLALAPLLATACTVGPNYQPPKLAVEDAYDPAATQPGAQADPAWWKLLKDEQLNSLIATATEKNLDMKVAQSRFLEARAQRAVIGGAQGPMVNADAAYSNTQLSHNAAPYNAFSVPGFPWEFNNYQMGFDARWEIDLFGGTHRAVESAVATLQAAKENQRATVVSLQAEVARNYVELRGFQRQRTLAQHNLDLQNQTLTLTRDRVKNGVGSELDVSRAMAMVAATAAEVPLFDRGEQQTLHRLAVLTNQPLESLQALHKDAPIPVAPETLMVGVPAELLRRRPDIRRAERELAAATARVGVAEADLYPKLSLTGVFNLQSASIEELWSWNSRAFSLGPAISWPIFESGRLHAVIAVRSAQQEQTLLAYEQTVQRAIAEVRDQMVSFSTERRRHTALAQAVAADRDAFDLATKLYAQGLTDFLTVLDAERQLDQAENALARSETQLDTTLIGLYKALGGGWLSAISPQTPTLIERPQTLTQEVP